MRKSYIYGRNVNPSEFHGRQADKSARFEKSYKSGDTRTLAFVAEVNRWVAVWTLAPQV